MHVNVCTYTSTHFCLLPLHSQVDVHPAELFTFVSYIILRLWKSYNEAIGDLQHVYLKAEIIILRLKSFGLNCALRSFSTIRFHDIDFNLGAVIAAFLGKLLRSLLSLDM